MKTKLPNVFILHLTLLLFPTLLFANTEPFQVSVIKVNKSYYMSDMAFYTARCNVQNKTEQAGKFYVRLMGLSQQGVKLHTIQLSGTIKKHSTKVLRMKNQMDAKTYKKIKKWIAEEAEFY